MDRKRKKLSMLIMPTDECNMNCIYCFHKAHHGNNERMSLETVRRIYDITFKSFEDVTIIWHGGEPLCMGADFYREAISMQKDYRNTRIRNRMQTNLTMLSQPMVELVREYNIGVGSSLDGVCNEELRGRTAIIESKRQLLINSGLKCGFIMVVSRKNIDSLNDSYDYFKAMNANFTMNPYISNSCNECDDLKLDVVYAAEKMIELFEYWIGDVNCKIHLDYFERIINYIIHKKKTVCKYTSCLGKWMGIRYNGEIVPCNRFFPDEYSYGNVYQYSDISEAFKSAGFNRLLNEAILRREKCKQCAIYAFCEGGCNNVAYNENGISANNGDSCYLTRTIYEYINKRVQKIIDQGNLERINPQIRKIMQKKAVILNG